MPEMEQSRKMVNQESFLRQRIEKANEQLKKQRREITRLLFHSLTGKSLHSLNVVSLNDLGWLIDQSLEEIRVKIKILNEEKENKQVQVEPTGLLVPATTDH
ncbi:PREDICTED: agamous MADS-box [Prunus dulcis]|uniref:PREDICTED: agamous MADS-box n=1 Tax=Prunus dulcis TaxID=3755 RepID=A0A5E4EKM6_PRUDU|nr:PREDICTED: agamous MADS-box [Prunus dulcis]